MDFCCGAGSYVVMQTLKGSIEQSHKDKKRSGFFIFWVRLFSYGQIGLISSTNPGID